jgi:hypothetical protein
MSELHVRILDALDDALAQEIGARLRQAALNNPPRTGGAAALPDRFEDGLLRLKAMHAQAKMLVRKVFEGDGNVGIAHAPAPSSSAFGERSLSKTRNAEMTRETARPVEPQRKIKPVVPRRSKKRAARKPRQA